MKASLWKEARLLLPAWCGAVLLFLPLYLFPYPRWGLTTVILTGAFILGLLLPAVSTFGREFADRTFQLYLSQPLPRSRMWWQKMSVLCVATLTVWLIFWIRMRYAYGFSIWTGATWLAVAFAITGTGLWTTLLFRQIMPAFCFSLLLPAIFFPIIWEMAETELSTAALAILFSVSAAYALGAFAFAGFLFSRAQDLQAWRVDLSLLFKRKQQVSPAFQPGYLRSGRRPIRSLIGKEVHLHRVNLICGALLFLAIGLTGLLVGDRIGEGFEGVQIAFILTCLFIPVLVGSVTIAEERKLGALAGQQCLPVSRFRQFLVKLFVTSGALLLLALVLPVLVAWAVLLIRGAHLAEGAVEVGEIAWSMRMDLRKGDLQWLLFLGGYTVVVGAMAFYASSLSRSTVGALGLTIVGLFAAGFLLTVVHATWQGFPLLMFIGLPVGTTVLVLLSFRNFCEPTINSEVWRRNARWLGSVSVAIFILTSLVHYRTWELVLPEPRLGEPEPSLANGATAFTAGPHGPWIVLLPDGRLWVSDGPDPEGIVFPESGTFLGEKEWTAVAASVQQFAGIQADGSLWRSLRRKTHADRYALEALGDGRHWLDIAGGRTHFLAVQADGTLWGWGRNGPAIGGDSLNEHIDEPVQIGSDSDWTRVFASEFMSFGVKQDGSVWRWGTHQGDRLGNLRSIKNPERWEAFPDGNLLTVSGSTHFPLAVLTDGTLWTWREHGQPHTARVQRIGTRSDWRSAVLGSSYSTVALSEDGTLWSSSLLGVNPTQRLSGRSGWVAITAFINFGVARARTYALAADGSWWVWEKVNWHDDEEPPPLLAPSRWPSRLGQ